MRLPHLFSTPPPFTFISPLVESQISELGTIRRSLFDLEAQHERAHSHYEEEIKRIHSELVAIRQSGTAPVSLGIPGRSPRQLGAPAPFPNTPAMSEAHPSSQLLRHRPLERDLPERALRERSRDAERDLDRIGDQQGAKRQKTRWNYPGSSFFSSFSNITPHSHISGTRLFFIFIFQGPQLSPRSSGSDAPSNSLGFRIPPGPAQPIRINYSPSTTTMADELKLQHPSSEYVKDGGDWCAVYNSQVRKSLDINLVHTFVHSS